MMGTITIRATEDVFLGSLQLAWLSVRADGRTEVFARGRHLAFRLEPPPTQEESPLVLIARAVAEAARIENHGIPPRLPGEKRSAYLDRLADLDQVEERRQADIVASSFADEEPDVPPDRTDEIEQQPGASKPVVDDALYQLQRDADETDENYRSRSRMLGCDSDGFIRLPRWRPTDCLVPCMICGKPLQDESAGNNQPIGGLPFQCVGHWPSAIFDAEPGWLEINICESCLHSAVERRRVLHGERANRPKRTSYRLWHWPKRQ